MLFVSIVAAALALTPASQAQKRPAAAREPVTASGLRATLWGEEPGPFQTAAMDIDELGQVWLVQSHGGVGRIVILTETGQRTVLTEGAELRSPQGIAVVGERVYVTQSPTLWKYRRDAHGKIEKKEQFLSGFGGEGTAFGLRSVLEGPDGLVYMNTGQAGFDVRDSGGNSAFSSPRSMVKAGAILHAEPDATRLRVVAHNFRSPSDLAMDSFGNLWQADAGEDDRDWSRLNFILPGGNYGYLGQTGRTWWQDQREPYHSDDPGIIPNVARLAGSDPRGLAFYEGSLLSSLRGKLLLADSRRGEVLAFQPQAEGAGFRTSVETVFRGAAGFRPVDVASAPDGSVLVAGSSAAGTRIYRLAPAGSRLQTPRPDLDSEAGLVEALSSPALSVWSAAAVELRARRNSAYPALMRLWKQEDPVMKARALWLLGALGEQCEEVLAEAVRHPEERLRVTAVRVIRRYDLQFPRLLLGRAEVESQAVNRELALSVADAPLEVAAGTLRTVMSRWDGKDRWYLEAIVIGAKDKEVLVSQESIAMLGSPYPWEFLWALRPASSLPFVLEVVGNPAAGESERRAALRVMGAFPIVEAGIGLANFLRTAPGPSRLLADALAIFRRQMAGPWSELRNHPDVVAAMRRCLGLEGLQRDAADVVGALAEPQFNGELEKLFGSAQAEVRLAALRAMARNPAGASRLRELQSRQALPKDLQREAAEALKTAPVTP